MDAMAPVSARPGPCNAMTVDVEDYFQVSAFEGTVDRADWDRHSPRVEANTDRILALFDEADIRATFFTLGWVAERFPGLVRRIVAAGHELASHGWSHVRASTQDPRTFHADCRRTREYLEDLAGVPVRGYRAASYSIGPANAWAHRELERAGYAYSSSVYPVRHDLYGWPGAPRFPYRPNDGELIEIPVTTVRWLGRNWPAAGGGYFRLLPYVVSRAALRRVNRRDRRPGMFYFHPWEVDPGQPRQPGLALRSRFRHYVNLHRTEERLRRLLRDFHWDRMDRVFLEDGGLASRAQGWPAAAGEGNGVGA